MFIHVNDPNMQPEIGLCHFLDDEFPDDAPHSIYASYARDWTISKLHEFYSLLCKKHNVDAVIAFDGGTDSLVRGDEAGLGDPIEVRFCFVWNIYNFG